MTLFLMVLAGAGLLGCFLATLGHDLARRNSRSAKRLVRPRTLNIRYE